MASILCDRTGFVSDRDFFAFRSRSGIVAASKVSLSLTLTDREYNSCETDRHKHLMLSYKKSGIGSKPSYGVCERGKLAFCY